MTIQDVINKAKSLGMTHMGDIYSYRGRKIAAYEREIKKYPEDYAEADWECIVDDSPTTSYKVFATSRSTQNELRFWKQSGAGQ